MNETILGKEGALNAMSAGAMSAFIHGRLMRNLPDYFRDARGGPFTIEDCGVKASTYPIYRFRVSCPGLARPMDVFVKFAPKEDGRNEGLIEFENLKRMHEGTKDGIYRYRSPRPLDYWTDVDALVTEGFEGEPFIDALKRQNTVYASREARAGLRANVEAVAGWFRHFHSLDAGIERVPHVDAFEKGEEAIDALKGSGFNADIISSIEGIRREISAMCGRQGPYLLSATKHGDPALDNILVRGTEVCVLDLSYSERAPVFEDIARFAVALETINPYPAAPDYSFKGSAELKDAFLRVYLSGKPQNAVGEALLHGFILNEILLRCRTHLKTAGNYNLIVRGVFDIVIKKIYTRLLKREIKILSALMSAGI
jgi:tRNA A-37 threonylcarbamoyl transferase component Bud32